jgi:23S rRNA (guanosine2251-2'-O)-methyltransferase
MSKSRRKKQGRFLAGHQRSWLWGRHPVTEVIEAGRWPVMELYLADTLPVEAIQHLQSQAEAQGTEVAVETAERLRELGHVDEHQGFLARMGPFPYASIEEVLRGGEEGERDDGTPGLWLVLDAIQDTFNFGAIVRSAEAMGARGIFVGTTSQAGVNSLVARASAGAVNRIPIAEVEDLSSFVETLRASGTRIVAADEKGGMACMDCDFRASTALVLGNEGHGVRAELLSRCDSHVCIPMTGSIASLNVAAAAAVLLYEAWRQKNRAGKVDG